MSSLQFERLMRAAGLLLLAAGLISACGNSNSSNDEDLHTADTPSPTRSVQLSPSDGVTLAGSTVTVS